MLQDGADPEHGSSLGSPLLNTGGAVGSGAGASPAPLWGWKAKTGVGTDPTAACVGKGSREVRFWCIQGSQPWGECSGVSCLCPCLPRSLLGAPGAAAHTVNMTPFFAGALVFTCSSLCPGLPHFGLPRVCVVALRCSELGFEGIFQSHSLISCSPEATEGDVLPHWAGWRGRTWGRGASFPLVSVKFPFWKQRGCTCCVHSAMPGGRHGKKTPRVLVWLLLKPRDPSGSCLCSHLPLLPPVPIVTPFLLQSIETQEPSPPRMMLDRWKCRMGQLPSSFRACPGPGCCSPASPRPCHRPQCEGRSFWGPVTPLGWFGPRLSVPWCVLLWCWWV